MSDNSKRVHFIAIGGSAMHNLALALKKNGFEVTGSDDEIFEPSYSRLAEQGLLPAQMGWNPDNISTDLGAIILGMHARTDNPELIRAKELGLKIYSYPEYIYENSKNKQRIVIAGSHGKTSITSMILHVLKQSHKEFDYLVGARLDGFENMVQLSNAPIIVIEGDEYLSSPIDRKPKFIHYQHHIAVISGIAWDHINVFPTFEDYVQQFEILAGMTPRAGSLIYCDIDPEVKKIGESQKGDSNKVAYGVHPFEVKDGITYLKNGKEFYEIQVFGEHNLMNINAAKEVCLKLGIKEETFYKSMQSFKGAANRLELLAKTSKTSIFKDFAHAPSKLKATTNAVKKQFPDRKLIACLELHTFSSLNKNFLSQYYQTFSLPDTAIVYFNPETLKHKRLPEISTEDVKKAFGNENILVFNDSKLLQEFLIQQSYASTNLLLMSSGNFDGINLKDFANKIIEKV